jgi:hypothetical protein
MSYELEYAKKEILNNIIKYNDNQVQYYDIPEFPYRDNWFNKEIVLELAYIRKIIYKIDYNRDIKDFLLINLSSIIRSVSNADDNCTRTVIRKRLNKQVYPSTALRRFIETFLINTLRMQEFSLICNEEYKPIIPDNLDARNINLVDKTFDLAVTSPPYANAVDYPRTHQLESYWLGLAKGSLTPLKKMHVGTESVSVSDYRILHETGIASADKVLKEIFSIDERRSFIAYKYLMDMKENLSEVFKVLKPNGKYVIVVGNNKIRGILFESWKYIIEIAQSVGFRLDFYFGSEIIKHFIKVPREERINTDWVIILRKRLHE